MKKLFYSSLFALAVSPAFGQEIDIAFSNIEISGTSFSFDVVMEAGSAYSSLTQMDASELRFLINTGSGSTSTVSSVVVGGLPTGYTALGGTTGTEPDPMPSGSDYFFVSLQRGLTTDDVLTTPGGAITIATVTVTMDAAVPDESVLTLLPALPDPTDASGPYAWWSYDGNNAEFAGDYEVPLPVAFISFAAQKVNNTAVLNWATAMEMYNVGFDVERSTDGRTFTKVGYVATKAAGGNSTATLNYNFKDEQPAAGVNYYRLKQRDIDGKFSFSTIASVAFGDAQPVAVYPNPANSSLTVQGVNAGYEIRFVDITGKIAMVHTAASAIETLNVSGLAAGMYVMQVWNNSTVVTSMQIAKK